MSLQSPMTYTKWTLEKLVVEARKFQTKQKFRIKSSSAYAAAKYRGIIEKICSHMTPAHVSWSDEMLATEAKKYQSRIDFKSGSDGAYQVAHNRGLIRPAWKNPHFCRAIIKQSQSL